MSARLISIIVPVFNEEKGILKFLDGALYAEIKEIKRKYVVELIVIDDGSRDKTIQKIQKSRIFNEKHGKRIKTRLVVFSKNFGKESALAAGISYARGDAVVMIDADGQHPASAISKMIQEWENGAVVVTAVRAKNKTRHKLGSKIFYRVMNLLGSEIKEGAMDFRLIDRTVADEYNRFTEHNRITRGLIDWLGFPQKYLEVKIRSRETGEGTYSRKKLLGLAVDSFVSMSRTPLLLFGYLGLFIMVFSLILGLFILIQQYILGDPLNLDWSGAVAVSVFIAFLVGIVLVSQAISALYISQTHIEVKNRPLFVIDKRRSVGLEQEGEGGEHAKKE